MLFLLRVCSPVCDVDVQRADHMTAGYKQYDTGRTYMAKMGDWRENKDVELELDGIGGVNILVKADVHRSGMLLEPALLMIRW